MNGPSGNFLEEFRKSLEPDVIINHDPIGNVADNLSLIRMGYVPHILSQQMHPMKPDISITPIQQEPIKLKNIKREYSPTKDNKKVQKTRSRQPVRLVTEAEAAQVAGTYIRRKSLPLEKCHICKKYFRRMKTHLLKHEQFSITPNSPLSCTYCAKTFNTQSNLLIHMRTHTGDKPYVCDVCHKGFAQSCNLVNHVRIHTGERPFKCPHCDKAFTQSGNLNNHVRLHTDEKPFKCHFCDKAFVQSGNLNSHIKNNHKIFEDIAPNHTNMHKDKR